MKHRLSNALTKIIKLEGKGDMRQITGRLHDGDIGYCLSGAFGMFFGVEKEHLTRCGFMQGEDKDKAFGDITFRGRCPLYGEELRSENPCYSMFNDVQSLIVHLNDDHRITFTKAQKIIEELEL